MRLNLYKSEEVHYGVHQDKPSNGPQFPSSPSPSSAQSYLSVHSLIFCQPLIPVVMLSYLRSVKWANGLATMHTSLNIITSVVLLLLWTISTGIFNMHDQNKSEPDLWSYSCRKSKDTTSSSSSLDSSPINWDQYCLEQVPLPLRSLLRAIC